MIIIIVIIIIIIVMTLMILILILILILIIIVIIIFIIIVILILIVIDSLMMIQLRLQNCQPVSVLNLQSDRQQGKHFKMLINRLLNVRNSMNKRVYHVVWKAAGGLQFVCVMHFFSTCSMDLSEIHAVMTCRHWPKWFWSVTDSNLVLFPQWMKNNLEFWKKIQLD